MEWHIQDFPEELLVKLKEGYLREVVDSIGGQRRTARLLGVCFPYIHQLVHGKKSFSLRRLFQIIELSPQKERFFEALEKNIIRLKSGGRGHWFRVDFPLRLTPELARIVGHLLGDGNIRRTSGVNVRYGNSDHLLVKSFIKDMNSVFGPTKCNIWRGNRGGCEDFMEVSFTSGIGRVLRKFFGQCDTYDGEIAEPIMKASEEVKKEVVKVLFDDEGTISEKGREILIFLVNKKLLQQMRLILAEFDIKTNFRFQKIKQENKKDRYTISITGRKNQRLFWKFIGLTPHTIKWKKFKNYFESLKPYGYDIDQLIINVIKKDKRSYSEILKIIKIPESTFYRHLKNLQKQNIIYRINCKWGINEQK